ncbi:NAD-dependent epimerase/dehydratase family protein [Nocardia bovistercoris]|uniref:NAD-dependent epimerase/dehydratase family protein n=1 Tax=Nocardia bovistercoris TaxID=2785916 RepID=A0A931N684_9NOCA|nr:NAD-dependent epimerase/dehydratase family protein [Nocardia bovistercoris]MBH0780694.1 NAD-dependent epimerase/dehydratase family protein [Nocardia bovistercoris]
MSEHVLVTGGTGFVGGWAVAELLRRGYRVRAAVRDLTGADTVRAAVAPVAESTERLDFVQLDLLSDTGWSEAMDGVDSVMHIAAQMGLTGDQDARRLIDVARGGSQRVLDAATRAGIRRVVMTSAANAASHSSYTVDDISDETLWTDPDDPALIPYRRAKTLAEKSAWEFVETTSGAPELTTVLPGAVFGPVLRAETVGSVSIIARMLAGRMPWIPRIGLEVVDVRDLVDLHIRALESPAAAGQRFLGTGEFLWMRDIARTLRADLGTDAAKVSTRPAPDLLVRLAARRDTALAELIPALGRKNRHSTAKAHELLDWRPRPARETVTDCARSLFAHAIV